MIESCLRETNRIESKISEAKKEAHAVGVEIDALAARLNGVLNTISNSQRDLIQLRKEIVDKQKIIDAKLERERQERERSFMMPDGNA